MLILRFQPMTGDDYWVGPVRSFCLRGNRLCLDLRDEDEIAYLQDGKWQYAGRWFAAIETDFPAHIRWESGCGAAWATHGPFGKLRLVGGTIRCGPQFEEVLARWDESSQAWLVGPEERNCPTLVITAVPAAKKPAKPAPSLIAT